MRGCSLPMRERHRALGHVRSGSDSERLRPSISSPLHPLRADMERTSRIVRFVPYADIGMTSKFPVQRNNDHRDDQCPDRDREAEFPKIAEAISAWPIHHQAHAVGEG